MSYRDLQAMVSSDEGEQMSTMKASPSMMNPFDTIDRKDLSPSEETNLVRLFMTFSVEIGSDSDADTPRSSYNQQRHISQRVLELPELKSLLMCLGIQMTDEMFDKMKTELHPKVPGELTFEEFVTFMVRSQDLRALRESMEQRERMHVEVFSKDRFMADSTWRWFWDLGILLITSYYMLLVAYEWVVTNPMTAPWWTAETIFSLVFIADIVVYGNTVTKDNNGRAVDQLKQVLSLYLRRTFVFDLIGTLPIDLIVSFALPHSHHISLAWRIPRGFRLARVVRVVKSLFDGVSIHGFLKPRFVYLTYTISPVLKALAYFVYVVHYLAIGWMIVKNNTTLRGDVHSYIDSLYLVLYTLSTCGYGDLIVEAGAQRLYCCFLFLGGVVMNGLVISQMSVFLSKADIQNERKDKMRETLAVLSHFDIPRETQSEILSFQHHLLSANLGSSHDELMGSLPQTIQESLGLFMRIKFIAMVPMFASSPIDCQEALATTLVNIVFHPHEFIIVAGEIGREMYFLGHGAADVIGPTGIHFATLRKGGFFGEIALLVDGARRNASIKALTYCDTFRLQKRDFQRIMHKFPHFRKILEEEVADRVQKFKESTKDQSPKAKRKQRKSREAYISGDASMTMRPPSLDTAESPGLPGNELQSFIDENTTDTARQRMPGSCSQPHLAFQPSTVMRRTPGSQAFTGVDSPRHARGRVNFNSLAGGGRQIVQPTAAELQHDPSLLGLLGRRRSSGGGGGGHRNSNSGPGGQVVIDREILIELAERVALLERRHSANSAQQTPLIPPAYQLNTSATRSSNAGKSRETAPRFTLADVVSSDDGDSALQSPRHRFPGYILTDVSRAPTPTPTQPIPPTPCQT
jgi:CRP-like cAMP-binding protein